MYNYCDTIHNIFYYVNNKFKGDKRMRKIWLPCTAAILAFLFIFSVQSNSFAAGKKSSVSTYIKGARNDHWTGKISTNSNRKLRIVISNNNGSTVAFHVTNVKSKKKVISETKSGKGKKTYTVSRITGTYQLRLYCYDKRPYNRTHCNAKATVYNY